MIPLPYGVQQLKPSVGLARAETGTPISPLVASCMSLSMYVSNNESSLLWIFCDHFYAIDEDETRKGEGMSQVSGAGAGRGGGGGRSTSGTGAGM